LSFLISPAYAQSAAGGAGFDPMQLAPFILIFVVFYFMLIRPQQQKAKKHRELLATIRRGDKVVTAGGIVGKVFKVVDDLEVMVEIADGVVVRVVRQTLTDVLSKTEPAAGGGDTAAEAPKAKPARRGSTKAAAPMPAPATPANDADDKSA
jgi:preprotein translocase subunit YajC